jgi:hypothetical protein
MNQLLIEQYVAGTMGEAEAEAFEEYCLSNPEFARQVELEQRLKAGLAQVASGSTAEFVRSESSSWKVAMAASVVLAVCAGLYLWQRGPVLHPHILAAATGQIEPGAASLRLALVRGAENVPLIPKGVVRIEIVGLFDMGFHYSVMLDQLEPGKRVETVAALYGQPPASPMSLSVLLDGDQLASGNYSLRIVKQGSHDEPLDFGFMKL